jgi:putative DNA primase/helicase
LHSTGADWAFDLWDTWSQQYPEKYSASDQAKIWKSFSLAGPAGKAPITFGTLVHLARAGGYQHRNGDTPGQGTRAAFILSEKGRPRAIVANVLAILEEDPRWRGVLGYNEFIDEVMLLQRPPWTQDDGGPWVPRPLTDTDGSEANAWMQRQAHYELYCATALVNEALDAYAARHPYHPVRDFLTEAAEVWDGKDRLGSAKTNTWLHTYCYVEENAYIKAIAPKILIGAVARVMRPGCKVDTMPIMESRQGLLKSTVWRLLASDQWFNDSLGDLRSKDARQDLRGVWIVEFSDLSRIRGAEVEHIKAFLSQTFDRYRPSYGRRAKTFMRQNVFVGSTNEEHYFKDVTGNRRFWPFPLTTRCDIDALQRDRAQLWGEAVLRYRQRELWYLTEGEEVLASREQQARVEVDAWEECLLDFIAAYSLTQQGKVVVGAGDLDVIPSTWLFERALGLTEKKDWTRDTATRVSRIMQKHGWRRRTVRDPETKEAVQGYRQGVV